MTDTAALAAIDQLIAANRDAADFLAAGPGSAEVWPDLGAVTRPIVDAMLLGIGAAHLDGEGTICEHLRNPGAWGIWFPRAHWQCNACAMAAFADRIEADRLPFACDACGTDLTIAGQPTVIHRWKISIPPQSAVITRPDGTPATRFTPPMVIMLLMCRGCGQRNRPGRPIEGGELIEGGDTEQGADEDPGD